MNTTLLHLMTKNWWCLMLRGLAAIVFGIVAVLLPGLTLLALVILFGTYALVDGVLALIEAFRGHVPEAPRWWLGLMGVVSLLAGAATFAYPGLTTLALLVVIGTWFMLRGVLEIVGAVKLRREIEGEWLLILSGLLSVLFGFIMVMTPGTGALALVWLIAIGAVMFGVLLVGLSLRLYSRRDMMPPGIPHAPRVA